MQRPINDVFEQLQIHYTVATILDVFCGSTKLKIASRWRPTPIQNVPDETRAGRSRTRCLLRCGPWWNFLDFWSKWRE